jgi:hypothetical protein
MPDPTTALAPIDLDPDSLPSPIFSGDQMVAAFAAFRDLKTKLIAQMPESVITVEGRAFCKKAIWRGLGVAFALNVELVEERDFVRGAFLDGQPNFGYLVIYRATAPNGRFAIGDGACMAIEKAARFKCPHPHPSWKGKSEHWPHESCPDYNPAHRWRELPAQATEHNIRSHAHTRAFNRAISNLVGFGEVSAEEVDRDEHERSGGDEQPPHPALAHPVELPPERKTAPRGNGGTTARISEPQVKRLWAIASNAGWNKSEVHAHLLRYGFEHADEITRDRYEQICGELEHGVDGTR